MKVPKPMTEFQIRLNEKAHAIDDMVKEMDDNALDIKNTIEIGIEELNKIDNERNEKTKHLIPG